MSNLLKKTEVALLLKVSTRTVDNLVQKGVLPVVHLGRIVRFPAKELHEVLEKYTVNKRSGSTRRPVAALAETRRKTKQMAVPSPRNVSSSPKASAKRKAHGGQP